MGARNPFVVFFFLTLYVCISMNKGSISDKILSYFCMTRDGHDYPHTARVQIFIFLDNIKIWTWIEID